MGCVQMREKAERCLVREYQRGGERFFVRRENLPTGKGQREGCERHRKHVGDRTRVAHHPRLHSTCYNINSIADRTVSNNMFAPPPVQLSRAEVEARLAARKENAEAAGSLNRSTSTASDLKYSSLHRIDSRSPNSPRKDRVSGKADKIKVSAPTTSSPPEETKQRSGVFKFTAGEVVESPELPNGFGEHPRRAPVPPKPRSTRPPSQWFESRVRGAPPPRSAVPAVPNQSETPPPIPPKSPKRQQRVAQQKPSKQPKQSIWTWQDSFSAAVSNMSIDDTAVKSVKHPHHLPRSYTAPASGLPHNSIIMAKPGHSRAASGKATRLSSLESDSKPASGSRTSTTLLGVKGAKVDKPATKRISTVSNLRAAPLDFDELKFFVAPKAPPRRATDGEIQTIRSSTPPEAQLPWKRRRKGETMSMLLETGFFPAESLFYNKSNPDVNIRVKLPPPISLLNKELPDTPTSIMATPTEMYQNVPPRPTRPVVRNPKVGKKRTPLAPLKTTNAKANSSSLAEGPEDVSPSRLSAIPEHGTVSENSPPSSGITTLSATQIHLRGGSVVTVSPPELTAWQKSIYVQGPIKLPKPVIVPRKNSVASLEPFQEAIEQVYQEALNIPRRRSDDAVVDDVCDFFDDFGFDEVNFEGDLLRVDDIHVDEIYEDPFEEMERFAMPPADEQLPSPVEKVVAKEIVETTMSKPSPVPKPPIPPIENEETLRARGIARLAHGAAHRHVGGTTASNGRKDSLTLSRAEPGVLPLLPLQEESMLDAVLEPSRADNSDVKMEDMPGGQGFDWDDDDVEELDGNSFWLAPGMFPRRRKNPMKKVRRFVANASAVL